MKKIITKFSEAQPWKGFFGLIKSIVILALFAAFLVGVYYLWVLIRDGLIPFIFGEIETDKNAVTLGFIGLVSSIVYVMYHVIDFLRDLCVATNYIVRKYAKKAREEKQKKIS